MKDRRKRGERWDYRVDTWKRYSQVRKQAVALTTRQGIEKWLQYKHSQSLSPPRCSLSSDWKEILEEKKGQIAQEQAKKRSKSSHSEFTAQVVASRSLIPTVAVVSIPATTTVTTTSTNPGRDLPGILLTDNTSFVPSLLSLCVC